MEEVVQQRLVGVSNTDQDIVSAVFQEWLVVGGRIPVSWESLVGALQDMKLELLAEAVRKDKCGSVSDRSANRSADTCIKHMFK